MVLHLPLLSDLRARFPAADVLIGKCHLTSAVRAFFDGVPPADHATVAGQVAFLADDRTQLDELVGLAMELGVTLRVAIELDVGLGRSGVAEPGALPAVLDAFLATSAVRFAGLLGYDGHIAHVPSGIDDAWDEATARYQAFVDVLNGPGYEALAGLPDLSSVRPAPSSDRVQAAESADADAASPFPPRQSGPDCLRGTRTAGDRGRRLESCSSSMRRNSQ